MNKHTVLINPKAGNIFQRRRSLKLLRKIEEGVKADIYYTSSKQDLQQIAMNAYEAGCRSFFIFGGDGTIFDVINTLYPSALQDPISIGIFPSGTGNSMLKDFSSSPDHTLEAIIGERTKGCDLIELRTKEKTLYSSNIISVGLVAKIAKMRNFCFSWMGPLGYVFAVICILPFFRARSYAVVIDGDRIQKHWSFISCNNTRYTGGNMMMAPHAKPNDQKIAVVLVLKKSMFTLLKTFPKIFSGAHTKEDFVISKQASQIEFENPYKQPIMIDGELVTYTPEFIKVHPRALRVYAK